MLGFVVMAKKCFDPKDLAYLKNSLFRHRMSHFVFLDYDFFLQDFDGVQLVCCLLTTHNHLKYEI